MVDSIIRQTCIVSLGLTFNMKNVHKKDDWFGKTEIFERTGRGIMFLLTYDRFAAADGNLDGFLTSEARHNAKREV